MKKASTTGTKKESKIFIKSIKLYEAIYYEYIDLFVVLLASKKFLDNESLVYHVISQLSDRVLVGTDNIFLIIKRHGLNGAIDLATLNRSIFETVVNLLYILKDDSVMRVLRYLFASIDSDFRFIENCKKWVAKGKSEDVRMGAYSIIQSFSTDKNDKAKLAGFIGVEKNSVKGLPSIRDRSKLIGEVWLYFYETSYRETSGWSHGSISRIIMSTFHQIMDTETADKAKIESLKMLSWTMELHYQLVVHLAAILDANEIVGQAGLVRKKMVSKLEPILMKSDHVHGFEEDDFHSADKSMVKGTTHRT